MGFGFDPGALGMVTVLLRVTLLLGAAVAMAWGLRRAAAGTRHVLWTATFAALLLLPAAMVLLPHWDLPVLAGSPTAGPQAGLASTDALSGSTSATPRAAPGGRSVGFDDPVTLRRAAAPLAAGRPLRARSWLLLLWLGGSAAALLSLAVGSYRLGHLVRQTEELNRPEWTADLTHLQKRVGVHRRVHLLVGAGVHTPMTAGWRRPVILLPGSALQWAAQRRQIVLAHELIHIRRKDAPRQLLSHLALSLYWFHPLSWIAARLAAATREQACDEDVIALGARPSDYARHLLALAETIGPVPAIITLPIIQPSNLERRVMAILEPGHCRYSSLAAGLVVLLITVLGMSAAVARPVPVPTPPAVASVAQPATVPAAPEHTCRIDGIHGNFRGTLSYADDDGEPTHYEVAGWHDGDRVIQRHVDGLRLCMRVHGEVVMADSGVAVRAVGQDSWVVLESEGDERQRLEITESADGIEHAWSIDGAARPFDADAQAWRDDIFTVLGGMWEISDLHRQVSTLRGKISSYRGHVSSLRGQISSYRGQVSSYRGQMSSYRGQVSSYRGQISSCLGKISSLTSALNVTSDPDTRAGLQHEIEALRERIQVIEAQIVSYDLDGRVAEVQEQIESYDLDAKLAAVQAEIDAFDLDGKIDEVQRQIEAYDLDGKVHAIEAQIEALDTDRRAQEIEARIQPELERLQTLIARLAR